MAVGLGLELESGLVDLARGLELELGLDLELGLGLELKLGLGLVDLARGLGPSQLTLTLTLPLTRVWQSTLPAGLARS